MGRWIVFLILAAIIGWSCKTDVTSYTEPVADNWELVPEFQNISIRYIVKYNNSIFISGINVTSRNGLVYLSDDGNKWELIREFSKAIGPLTISSDSLFCLGDSLYRYIISMKRWETVCDPQPLSQDPSSVGDMVMLNNKLYWRTNIIYF